MSLPPFCVDRAAECLLKARESGKPVPIPCAAPPDTASAYAVQKAVLAGMADPGGVWKMALLDGTRREAAILPRASLVGNGAQLQLPDGVLIEVETALVLARDPGSRPDASAIADIRIAFEFIAPRLEGRATPLWHMADSFRSAGVCLGESIPGWRDGLPDRLGITLLADNRIVEASETAAPLADALDFLGWLSAHALDQGTALKRGDVVITGARVGPVGLNGAASAVGTGMGASVSCKLLAKPSRLR